MPNVSIRRVDRLCLFSHTCTSLVVVGIRLCPYSLMQILGVQEDAQQPISLCDNSQNETDDVTIVFHNDDVQSRWETIPTRGREFVMHVRLLRIENRIFESFCP